MIPYFKKLIYSHQSHPFLVILGQWSHSEDPAPKLPLHFIPQVVVKVFAVHFRVDQSQQVKIKMVGLVSSYEFSPFDHFLKFSEALCQILFWSQVLLFVFEDIDEIFESPAQTEKNISVKNPYKRVVNHVVLVRSEISMEAILKCEPGMPKQTL